MLKNQREKEILNLLKNSGGFVSVNQLCKLLYASQSSIRRDLSSLESKGLVRKSYGGAELVTNYSNAIAFNQRAHHNISAKKIIAKKAATLIKDGNVIFLDQSSTAFYLASEISDNNTLTVVTNNIEIISLLATTGIKTICSGGTLSQDNRSCLVGTDAQYIFKNIYCDICFFSTKSLSADGIIYDCSREEVLVRASMLKNAAKKVFLCDSEKFNTTSAYKQCDLCEVDYLVSESNLADAFSSVSENLTII